MRELKKLIEFFDDPPGPLDSIKPVHVRQYLDWRVSPDGQKSNERKNRGPGRARANREKALLSHIWNWARSREYTDLANPCAGVEAYEESGRDIYVDDDMYRKVMENADEPTSDAMELAYLTGQRPSDVLKATEIDVRDGAIDVEQGKTGKKLRIVISATLQALLNRIADRKRQYAVHSIHLIVNEEGQPLTLQALQDRFAMAREAAGIAPGAFQFRDLRAKAATDKADSAGDIRQAQRQLGHSSVVMTERYVRTRRGEKVDPTR